MDISLSQDKVASHTDSVMHEYRNSLSPATVGSPSLYVFMPKLNGGLSGMLKQLPVLRKGLG